jgi:hypothetical protein
MPSCVNCVNCVNWALLLPIVVWLAACSDESEACEVVETQMLGDDEMSPEGVSGTEVLSMATPVALPFEWDANPSGEPPTNAMPGTTTEVNLALERGEGSVRRVVTEQVGTTEQNSSCGPTLFVPVRVRMTTVDGALDEVVEGDVAFGAALPGIPTFDATFAFDELVGWLRSTSADAGGELHAELGVGSRGWIGVTREESSGDSASEGWVMAGHWGEVLPPGDSP